MSVTELPVSPYLFSQPGSQAAPFTFTVPATLEVQVDSATATYDGTGAGGSFLPVMSFYSPSGVLIARMPLQSTALAAGTTEEVSWFPFAPVVSGMAPTPTAGGDGWVDDTAETWTYASSTSFTVPGDQRVKLQTGTKIKLTQTTVKYFTVASVSFAAGTTTVGIFAGTDFTLANAAITANFHSYAAGPQGWPSLFAWDANPQGWVTPTTSAYFATQAHQCWVVIDVTGTSNNVNTSFSLPFTPLAANAVAAPCFITNNGANSVNPGFMNNAAGTTTCQVYATMALGAWNASNTKRFLGSFVYYYP